MTLDSIAARVARYLTRHIAHLEDSLAALEGVDFSEPAQVESFTIAQVARDAASAQLDAEQAALLKEWRADKAASPAERAAVRALAQQGDDLARRLERAYDAAGALALSKAAVVELQANALRRGAGIARRFGYDPQDAGGYVDRRA